MSAGWLTLISLLGLAIGSFVNVVAYRVPRGLSVLTPPSSCPACGERIAAKDNLPVVGWLALRGRCRHCGVRIPARYPLVEAGTGVLYALAAARFGLTWELLAFLWFYALTMALVVTDLDHQRIPNAILLPGAAVGVALLGVGAVAEGRADTLLRALGGGGLAFIMFLFLALLTRGGFGMGDVKLAALLGWFTGFLGWSVLVAGVLLAFLLGGVAAMFLLISGRKSRKDRVPFAPAMIAGGWLATLSAWDMVAWFGG